MIDLEAPGMLKVISERIKTDIDKYCVTKFDNGHRSHLGASLIGNPCSRQAWFTFRWIHHTAHSGRLYRLFNRGHLEEPRFVDYLKGIGFEVSEFSHNGQQYHYGSVKGHYGGSLDGKANFPEEYQIPIRILLEFKTSGTGPKFNKLVKDGVILTKPVHYAQMSTYGWKFELTHALYMCVNKNDDDLHVEMVKLNWKLGEQMEKKAELIINSQTMPARISESPAFFECKYCDFLQHCFYGAKADFNCRSCVCASPVENSAWNCSRWNTVIPKEYIAKGCEQWKSII